jgi:membrane-associated protease RseP (regulator of RpoE activity)
MIILLLIIAVAVGLFYIILNMQDLTGVWKFLLVFVEMVLVGQILIRRYKLPSELGLILLKSKKGIRMIEGLAKHKGIFNFFADVGNSIAYGLLSLVIMKRRSVAPLIIGLLLLGFIFFLVAPSSFFILFEILGLDAADKSVSTSLESIGFGLSLVSLILLAGGLFLFILFGIVFYGSVITINLFKKVFLGTEFAMSPGATFLLPGVNLPLFEGLIALVVVLIVHEGAHAVLARIGKIPLLSSGIVFFGIIPVGAFVEPDEKKLSKLDDVKQTRVLAAGSTSNFITSCIFFLAFAVFALSANFLGVIQVEYTEAASLDGLVLDVVVAPFNFIYTTLGLIFALNFIVGAVNLLPLPLFDGYRIVDVNVKNKTIVKALMYATLVFFILNFVPHFF